MPSGTLSIRIDASDLEAVARNLAAALRNLPGYRRARITALARAVLDNTRDEAPSRTNRLRNSLYLEVVDGGAGALIREGEAYGRFVREGTRPHLILPVSAQALYWPGASHPVRRVNHPGTKANPYHERALERSRGDIEDAAQDLGMDIAVDITRPV